MKKPTPTATQSTDSQQLQQPSFEATPQDYEVMKAAEDQLSRLVADLAESQHSVSLSEQTIDRSRAGQHGFSQEMLGIAQSDLERHRAIVETLSNQIAPLEAEIRDAYAADAAAVQHLQELVAKLEAEHAADAELQQARRTTSLARVGFASRIAAENRPAAVERLTAKKAALQLESDRVHAFLEDPETLKNEKATETVKRRLQEIVNQRNAVEAELAALQDQIRRVRVAELDRAAREVFAQLEQTNETAGSLLKALPEVLEQLDTLMRSASQHSKATIDARGADARKLPVSRLDNDLITQLADLGHLKDVVKRLSRQNLASLAGRGLGLHFQAVIARLDAAK